MKRLAKIAAVLVVATVVASQPHAQPTTPTPARPAQTQLSAEDMIKQANELRAKVRTHIQRVQHLQARARNEKDVIKLTCVNDKFIKLKAQANIFDAAHQEFAALVDTQRRVVLFTNVTKAADEVRKIREEADVCVGEADLGMASESDFTSPDLLDDPTLGLPFDIEVEPPAYASPYI